jgi:hypothetical protein
MDYYNLIKMAKEAQQIEQEEQLQKALLILQDLKKYKLKKN